jgi:uncharacterized protein (TIGR00369 family)
MSIEDSAPRSRVVTWDDPAELAERGRGMAGLDFLRALQRGEFPPPPILQLMALELAEVGEGHACFTGVPGEYLYNPIGVVHGGFAATLLDSAMACAVHTTLPAGVFYTTIELKLNYIRAVTADMGRVRCDGSVIHGGRQVATAEGRLVEEATGRLLAHGTTTCLIIGGRH